MKEIKKLSELISPFVASIGKTMNVKGKFVDIYNVWTDLAKKENLPSDSILEDINKSTIFIEVNHPGSAQQIRAKANKIIQVFNRKFPTFTIKEIKVIINIFGNS